VLKLRQRRIHTSSRAQIKRRRGKKHEKEEGKAKKSVVFEDESALNTSSSSSDDDVDDADDKAKVKDNETSHRIEELVGKSQRIRHRRNQYIRVRRVPWERGTSNLSETHALVRMYNAIVCLRGLFADLCVHPDPSVFLENDQGMVLVGTDWSFDPTTFWLQRWKQQQQQRGGESKAAPISLMVPSVRHHPGWRRFSRGVGNGGAVDMGPLLSRLDQVAWRAPEDFWCKGAYSSTADPSSIAVKLPTPPLVAVPPRDIALAKELEKAIYISMTAATTATLKMQSLAMGLKYVEGGDNLRLQRFQRRNRNGLSGAAAAAATAREAISKLDHSAYCDAVSDDGSSGRPSTSSGGIGGGIITSNLATVGALIGRQGRQVKSSVKSAMLATTRAGVTAGSAAASGVTGVVSSARTLASSVAADATAVPRRAVAKVLDLGKSTQPQQQSQQEEDDGSPPLPTSPLSVTHLFGRISSTSTSSTTVATAAVASNEEGSEDGVGGGGISGKSRRATHSQLSSITSVPPSVLSLSKPSFSAFTPAPSSSGHSSLLRRHSDFTVSSSNSSTFEDTLQPEENQMDKIFLKTQQKALKLFRQGLISSEEFEEIVSAQVRAQAQLMGEEEEEVRGGKSGGDGGEEESAGVEEEIGGEEFDEDQSAAGERRSSSRAKSSLQTLFGVVDDQIGEEGQQQDEDEGLSSYACENFKADTTAVAFGVCLCGYPKSVHAESALFFGSSL
jgi:hypothetical protein